VPVDMLWKPGGMPVASKGPGDPPPDR
jgi:hypothetical protein